LVLTGFCLAAASAFAAKNPPNIVMIISDDQAWTDYSFMGHATLRTPNLDRLASQSLTFTRGYVPASLCCPSLASIVTGLYPHQHKVTSNDPGIPVGMTPAQFQQSDAFREGREVMNRHLEAVPTLPRLLAEKGYLSLQTGKWWQGHYSRGGFTHGMTQGQRHGDEGLDIGRKTMQPIYDFIETARKEDKPFFIWYAPMMPHEPHNPPERWLNKYKDTTPSLHMARYWAMVEWFDETVGDLLEYLDKNGLAENTIVVYLTDNGWIQDPDASRYAPKSKQSPYDGGLRTPILIRWPGRVKPQESQSLALSIDLMPTLLNAAGLRPTRDMQGINLLDRKTAHARKVIYGECFTHAAVDLHNPAANLRWRWVIEGGWKLLVPAAQNEPTAQMELYDLAKDSREERNLASAEPQKVKHLRQLLDRWWSGTQSLQQEHAR
jgi:arylsulfatase A-like enzyme